MVLVVAGVAAVGVLVTCAAPLFLWKRTAKQGRVQVPARRRRLPEIENISTSGIDSDGSSEVEIKISGLSRTKILNMVEGGSCQSTHPAKTESSEYPVAEALGFSPRESSRPKTIQSPQPGTSGISKIGKVVKSELPLENGTAQEPFEDSNYSASGTPNPTLAEIVRVERLKRLWNYSQGRCSKIDDVAAESAPLTDTSSKRRAATGRRSLKTGITKPARVDEPKCLTVRPEEDAASSSSATGPKGNSSQLGISESDTESDESSFVDIRISGLSRTKLRNLMRSQQPSRPEIPQPSVFHVSGPIGSSSPAATTPEITKLRVIEPDGTVWEGSDVGSDSDRSLVQPVSESDETVLPDMVSPGPQLLSLPRILNNFGRQKLWDLVRGARRSELPEGETAEPRVETPEPIGQSSLPEPDQSPACSIAVPVGPPIVESLEPEVVQPQKSGKTDVSQAAAYGESKGILEQTKQSRPESWKCFIYSARYMNNGF